MHSPIEQFEIHAMSGPLFSLGGHSIAFTNAALAMVLAVVLASALMVLTMRRRAVIPSRWQMLGEMLYNAVGGMLTMGAGAKGRPFLPFLFTIFIFILFLNLLGMMPHSLTVTAQLVANFALAGTLFAVIVGTGFARHGLHFLSLFVPHGVPMALKPLLTMIEFISFWVRPCSLSLRLFGNMLAGHILLKVFAAMTAGVATAGWAAAVGIFPLALNIGIIGFEFFVAFLQAYIFTVLASVYLRDALEMH